jgi:anti-sigma factor RsiW
MKCADFEALVDAYMLGELDVDLVVKCAAHAEGCAACRAVLQQSSVLVQAICDELRLAPTAHESAALTEALCRICPRAEPARAPQMHPRDLAGFLATSLATFVIAVTVLLLQAFGIIDMLSVVKAVGPAAIAVSLTVIVFVTTFVPIAITARRRPLNGMTFRR